MWNLKKKKTVIEKEIRPVVTGDRGSGEGKLEEDGQRYKLPIVR